MARSTFIVLPQVLPMQPPDPPSHDTNNPQGTNEASAAPARPAPLTSQTPAERELATIWANRARLVQAIEIAKQREQALNAMTLPVVVGVLTILASAAAWFVAEYMSLDGAVPPLLRDGLPPALLGFGFLVVVSTILLRRRLAVEIALKVEEAAHVVAELDQELGVYTSRSAEQATGRAVG